MPAWWPDSDGLGGNPGFWVKTRGFSMNGGKTRGFLVNPSFFQGLDAKGIYIRVYIYIHIYIYKYTDTYTIYLHTYYILYIYICT